MSHKPTDPITLSHQLQRIMALDCPAEKKVERALEVGAEYLNVETGMAVRTMDDDAVWEAIVSTAPDDARFSAGATLDLSKTYCRHVTGQEASLTVHDATRDGFRDDPAHQEFGVEAYFGTPLYQDEEVFGTVCFISQESQSALDIDESLVLELIGRFTQAVLVEADYEADLENTTELLSVITRVFRHNIRNKLTIIRGYLERYAEQSDIEASTPLDAADEIIELSEMAREIEKVVQATSDQREINLTNTIKTVCETVKDSFPSSSITVEAPDSLDYYARPTLQLALQEVIENAVKHTDGDAEVSVRVTEGKDEIEIAIQDAGSGLPTEEQTVLQEGTETPLIHSSGLGLWLAHTIITNHGGEITTTASDMGTTVTFTLARTPMEVKSALGDEGRRQEYDKFKQIFDEAIAPIVLLDDQARILEANERAVRLLGQPQKKLLGRDIEDFMTTDSSHETLDDLLEEVPDTVEIVGSDGATHLVEYSVTRDFEPGQHLIVGQDVTEQRNRKRELKQTKEWMEFALDATDTIVWEWNVDSDQATFHPPETELYGTAVETREDFLEVVHPADRQQVRDSLRQALETGEAKYEEVRIKVGDEVRWIEAPGKPVVGTDGTTRMIGVVRDITDRKEREQELERMRDFFREAEDLGDLGAWEFDADGTLVWTDGTRRIHEVSEGVTPTIEQAIEFYHPEDREVISQAVETAVETGESFKHEVRLITAQDTQRWVRVRGEVLDNEEPRTVRGFIQDITDQKEHEHELERTHELLEHTERIADVGSWEIDADTMDVFWSENLFEILGVDAEDEPPLSEALDVYHEDDRPVVETAVENALETGESFDIEVRFQRPDGEVRWLRVEGSPTVEDGEVVTLRGAVEDITDHKEIEAELRQERDLFEGIVETSPIGIAVVDADGTLTFINDRAEEIYGRSSEEIEEFTHDDPRWGLIDEDGTPLEAGSTAFDRVLSQEEPIYDQVVSLRQPDGDRVWVSVNGAPQWNDDGTLRQAIFAFEDITERRELETRVTEILGRVTDAFYALDEEFQFSHVNDRAEELLQASEEELLGEKLWEQYPEAADIDEVQDAFQTAMETQLPQSYELYFEPLEFHVEATVYPSQSGVSVYFRDITDQRTYEREIEQKNERLEEFARVISHDLRNPLNIARGRLALAKEEFESEDLDTVDTALDRMEQLIENTLSLVRKGDIIDSTAPVDLDDAVESAWAMVEGTGEHDECLQLESSGSETIQADYDRLCQLFENLFRNAIEHSDGDVTVRVGRLDDGLYIEDNGPGIPEDAREEVFQVGNSTSPEGTGFGLSIVKNIAEAHGWEITITEATAGGARFEITGVELGVK